MAECTKEQLEQVYNLGREHGKKYAEMKTALFSKKTHWLDNCDSYICPVCGFETDNPARFKCKCPACGFMEEGR